MQYEFDREIDRKHNCDLKWNKALLEARLSATVAEDFIPMWIADTDFACAPHILEAVRARTEQEIFGYCGPTEQFYEAVCWWEKQRFSWDVQPKQITALPSVVAGINIAIRAFSKEGDGVIIQPPVYDPFSDIVRRTGRNVVNNPLKKVNERYEMDFELLERQADASGAVRNLRVWRISAFEMRCFSYPMRYIPTSFTRDTPIIRCCP